MADRVAFDDRPCRSVEQCRADGSASKDLDVEPIAQHSPTDERNGRSRATRGLVRPLRSPALATLLVFLVLAVWHFRLTWAAPRDATIGVTGDPWLFVWFLKWDQFALANAHSPLVSHYLNVPAGVNLMWNTSLLLPGMLLAGVTAAAGPILTYNLLMTLAIALSAWSAYLVFRRYVARQLAAGVGGLLYGFSPYMTAHALGHLQLILAVTPPLVLVLVDEILVRQRPPPLRLGVALGMLAAAQLLTAEELLASELLVATAALALLVVLYPRQVRAHAPYAGKALGTAVTVGVLLVAWPLGVQFLGPGRPRTPIQSPGVAVTDLANFVVPTRLQRFAPAAAVAVSDRFTSNATEWDGYLGLPLLLLLVGVAVRWWRRPLVRVTSLLALGLAILSLGPRLHIAGRITRVHLPWRAVEAVPVVYNLLPNRLMLYVFLLAGLLVAVFADAVLARWEWRRVALGVAALALALVPLLPRSPAPSTRLTVPSFFADTVRRIPRDSVVLVAPFTHYPPTVAPMLWQVVAGMRYRMPEGYFVGADADARAQFGPTATPLSRAMETIQAGGSPPPLTPPARAELLGVLRGWRVQTVLVGPMAHQATMAHFFAALLGRPPTPVGGVLVWWAPTVPPPHTR